MRRAHRNLSDVIGTFAELRSNQRDCADPPSVRPSSRTIDVVGTDQWDDPSWLIDSDNGWTRGCRWLQAWWRHHELAVPAGPQSKGSDRLIASMLPINAPANLNFLDSRIADAVQLRLAEGVGSGIIERDRLFRNLLSSQPACFNLFGPFVSTPNRLLRWIRTIDEDAAAVTGVRFEWAPPRGEHFDGGSAFDAFVTYETGDARRRFVGVECKYAENLASSSIDVRDVYRTFTAESEMWAAGAAEHLDIAQFRQFWLNTLLAQSLALRSDEFDAGTTVVVAVSTDTSALQAVDQVRAELVEPDRWLRWMPYETILAAVDDDDDWRAAFFRRYLDFTPVRHLLSADDPRAGGDSPGSDTVRPAAGPLHGAALLIRSSDGSWAVPSTSTYGSERDLRDLLAENPSIIPGVGDPAVAAVVELGVPRVGRIDVVIIESSGTITVVEAKLAGNADMRRTVIGQVFAVCGGACEHGPVGIRQCVDGTLRARCRRQRVG